MCLCILLPYTTESVFDGVLVCCCDIVYPYFRDAVMCATDEESVRVSRQNVKKKIFLENIFKLCFRIILLARENLIRKSFPVYILLTSVQKWIQL